MKNASSNFFLPTVRQMHSGSTVKNRFKHMKKFCSLNHIHSFGRMDELDMDALKRLARSIQRFLGEEPTLFDGKTPELKFLSSRPMGGAWLLDGHWKRIGIDKLLVMIPGLNDLDVQHCYRAICKGIQRTVDPIFLKS